MGRREATRTPRGTKRSINKPTRRRVCPTHGWVNAVQRPADQQWMCPIDGQNAMTERQYMMLCSERNARRLQAAGG